MCRQSDSTIVWLSDSVFALALPGQTLSDRLRRYAEEGTRRDEHPRTTFREGPTGRRAGLVGGPDVWEVAMWIDDFVDAKDPVGRAGIRGRGHARADRGRAKVPRGVPGRDRRAERAAPQCHRRR